MSKMDLQFPANAGKGSPYSQREGNSLTNPFWVGFLGVIPPGNEFALRTFGLFTKFGPKWDQKWLAIVPCKSGVFPDSSTRPLRGFVR